MSRYQEAVAPPLVNTDSEVRKSDSEDGVVQNDLLILEPLPLGDAEKLGAEEPPAKIIAAKDLGPPDGGYGWVVVMCLLLGHRSDDCSACSALTAFTWGITAVHPIPLGSPILKGQTYGVYFSYYIHTDASDPLPLVRE